MGSRKALFFDVDGTLFSEVWKTVPKSAVRAVEEARRLGHLAFINSGRVYCLLDTIREQVEMDGYLCGCGTYIILEGKVVYARAIPHAQGLQIKEHLKACRVEAILEARDDCHFRRDASWMPKLERLRENIIKDGKVSPHPIEEDCYDFDKFCCYTDQDSDKERFIKGLEKDFDVIDRGDEFWECVPRGHSKSTAIQMVLDHYGLSLEDAYVFGDSTNDLSMFTYAKNAVLMGKHDKELEPYATFTTRTVEEDGIAYALKALGIIDTVFYKG
ncbi:MAG: HAD family phosphatase [Lachnospiraceae bacterium]|nr:HAD family phosphatase [Lachnospiraceae bacterium]